MYAIMIFFNVLYSVGMYSDSTIEIVSFIVLLLSTIQLDIDKYYLYAHLKTCKYNVKLACAESLFVLFISFIGNLSNISIGLGNLVISNFLYALLVDSIKECLSVQDVYRV